MDADMAADTVAAAATTAAAIDLTIAGAAGDSGLMIQAHSAH